MPQLRLHGIAADKVQPVSTTLVDELHALLECPREDFTIECVASTFVFDGAIDPGYPFVEVLWFDRGQSKQDQAAQIITHHIQQAGYANVDVFFIHLQPTQYYENGQHF